MKTDGDSSRGTSSSPRYLENSSRRFGPFARHCNGIEGQWTTKVYNTSSVDLQDIVPHPTHPTMRSSSSQSYAPECLPSKKNKMQSQREYRSKETDGFTELRDALLLVDPFDAPLGKDATRHQLLVAGRSTIVLVELSAENRITAAKKLRNLADENQKLALRLSAMPASELHEPERAIPRGMATRWYSFFLNISRFTRESLQKILRPLVLHGQPKMKSSTYYYRWLRSFKFPHEITKTLPPAGCSARLHSTGMGTSHLARR